MATCHLIEIQPNAYNKYLPETAEAVLRDISWRKQVLALLRSRANSALSLANSSGFLTKTRTFAATVMSLSTASGVTLIYHPRRKADVKMLTSRQDSLEISVHIVRIWLVFTLASPWVLSSIHIQWFNVTYKMVAE